MAFRRINDAEKLEWTNFSIDQLPDEIAAKYAEVAEYNKAAAEAKKEAEEMLSAVIPIPEGKRLVAKYNPAWKQLGIAFATAEEEKAAKKPKITLEQFRAQMKANGHAY
jgi:predicted Zn-dependent protease